MPAKTSKKKRAPQRNVFLRYFGICCICLGIAILAVTYAPLILQELSYTYRQIVHTTVKPSEIQPRDPSLGIVIPKIGANASIILDVDPYNSAIYQRALTRGVAHAKGTALPTQTGNSFLFSHSSDDLANAMRYNSIFYLLPKLTKGDEIWIFIHGTKHIYTVDSTSIVSKADIRYLTQTSEKKLLTLMTCWPPGTDIKRYLVIASVKE